MISRPLAKPIPPTRRASRSPDSTARGRDDFHRPSTVDDLTAQNVRAIVELEKAAQAQRSSGDRVADLISRFCGSMSFVWVHVVWFTVWIIANTIALKQPIDPYPFSFLTLVVSLEAIFLSTFIMISENRQERIDERRSHLDLQINLLAEQENIKMLRLLEQMARKMGVGPAEDPDVAVLEEATRPERLVEQIDESVRQKDQSEDEASFAVFSKSALLTATSGPRATDPSPRETDSW